MHGISGFRSFAGSYGGPSFALQTVKDSVLDEFSIVQAGGVPGARRTPTKFLGSRTKAGVSERANVAVVDKRTGAVVSLKRTLDVTKVVSGQSSSSTTTAVSTGASGFTLSANPFNPFQGGDTALTETGASSIGQSDMGGRPWWHYALGAAVLGGVGYAGYKLYKKKAA